MKTCPVCSLDLEDSFLYCPDDGSSLRSLVSGDLDSRPPSPGTLLDCESSQSLKRGVVLYCPACAAEYPLTFSLCPVHGVPLARHTIPAPSVESDSPALSEAAAEDLPDEPPEIQVTPTESPEAKMTPTERAEPQAALPQSREPENARDAIDEPQE